MTEMKLVEPTSKEKTISNTIPTVSDTAEKVPPGTESPVQESETPTIKPLTPTPVTEKLTPVMNESSVVSEMLVPASQPAAASPPKVTGTDLTTRLGVATAENLDSNLPATKPPVNNVVNNVNKSERGSTPQKLLDLKTVAVRNTEPTFMRMIEESTRVV
jgi:hypothetical protein